MHVLNVRLTLSRQKMMTSVYTENDDLMAKVSDALHASRHFWPKCKKIKLTEIESGFLVKLLNILDFLAQNGRRAEVPGPPQL